MKSYLRYSHAAALVFAFCLLSDVMARAVDIEERLMTRGFVKGRAAGTVVDTCMLHFISNVVSNQSNPHELEKVIGILHATTNSAHYLIDRNGKVFRLVKEEDTSFHAGKGVWQNRTNTLNSYSIGIEIMAIGTKGEMAEYLSGSKYDTIPKEHLGFTAAQYKALKELIADIRKRNPKILNDRKHIIGHDEYAPTRKKDPGSLFKWSEIGL